MQDTVITVVGNLVEDPRFHVTPEGLSRSRFRIASTSRRRDRVSGEWVDGDALFVSVVAWRQLADHCHDSLRRGDRVLVTGRLKQRQWVTKDHQPRNDFEIDADACGPDLARAPVLVQRVRRDQGRARTENQEASIPAASGEPSIAAPTAVSAELPVALPTELSVEEVTPVAA